MQTTRGTATGMEKKPSRNAKMKIKNATHTKSFKNDAPKSKTKTTVPNIQLFSFKERQREGGERERKKKSGKSLSNLPLGMVLI